MAAIKKALGDRASVRVDVNQAWSEPEARRGIPALEAAGVDLIEQPLSRDNRGAQARLSGRFAVPLMADEALHGTTDAFDIASRGAADVFALKINQAGGLYDAVKMAAIGEAAGIGLYGGTMLEGGVGTAASAQVFSVLPKMAWGTELFGPLLLTEEIVTEAPVYRDFHLHVPTTPGLGLTPDEDRLARFRRR